MKLNKNEIITDRPIVRWGPTKIHAFVKKPKSQLNSTEESLKEKELPPIAKVPKASKTRIKKKISTKDVDETKYVKTQHPSDGPSKSEVNKSATTGKKKKSGITVKQHPKSSIVPFPNQATNEEKVSNQKHKNRVRANYLRSVRNRVNRYKKYPYSARRLGLESSVRVRFQILSSGGLGKIQFPKGGHKLFQKACIKALRAAAPFEKPPSILAKQIEVETVISFRLR